MAETNKQLLANLTFALKNVYQPFMVKQIVGENIILQNLKMKTAKMSMGGGDMIIPVRTNAVESFAATQEDGAIARPTIIKGFTAVVPKRIHTAAIQWSDITDDWTRTDAMSYVQTKEGLMAATAEGFATNMNEMFIIANPKALARVKSFNAVTGDIVVYDEGETGNGSTYGLKYLRDTKILGASMNKTGTDLELSVDIQITADPDPATLTFNAKGDFTGMANDAYLYPEGTKNNATDGLVGIIDDGTEQDTYLGVSRTTNTRWRSYYLGSVAGANLENTILKMANSIRTKVGKNKIKKGNGWVIFTTPGVCQAYFEQMKPDRRYNMEAATKGATPVFNGGTSDFWITTPVTGPVQMITDIALPEGYLFLIYFSKEDWYISEVKPMGWWDRGGQGIVHSEGRNFILESDWYWMCQLVFADPRLAGKLTGITESVSA